MNSEMKSKYDRLLMALLGKEALVERWWISNNKAFDMKTHSKCIPKMQIEWINILKVS
jgi:hypothetical protein